MATPNFGSLEILPGYMEKALRPLVSIGTPESHEGKLTYRLTGAFLFHLLPPSTVVYLAVMAASTTLMLLSTILAAARITGDRVVAFFVGASVACLYPGSAGFATALFPYDPLAYLLIIAPFVSTNVAWIFVTCFLACWTDERAFLASSFAFLYYGFVSSNGSIINRRSIAVALAGALYLAGRFALGRVMDFPSHSPIDMPALKGNARFMHFITYYSLEGLWLVIFAAMAVAWRSHKLAVLGLMGLLCGQLLVTFMVHDLSRASAYLVAAIFPALGMVMLCSPSQTAPVWLRPLTCASAIICIIGLNYFVISWPGTDRCIFHFTSPLPLRLLKWAVGVGE